MNTVHFRISQISIPLLENQDEKISYFLSVQIGPSFVEFPLQLEDNTFLKSSTIISFNYESSSDYEFYIELFVKKPHSDQVEIASIKIPIRICKRNRKSNGCLEMDIKNKSFLDNISTTKSDDLDSDDEYESEEDKKSIKIFFEIHRSENKQKRFKAHYEELRDLNTAYLISSRQSFESSCSFTESSNKKKRGSNKLTLTPLDEDNQESELEQETEQKQKQQTKKEPKDELHQTTDEKDQDVDQDDLNDDEKDDQKQLLKDKNEKESPGEDSQAFEEEEEEGVDNDNNDLENKNEEEEKIESNDDSKIDKKEISKSKNIKEEELLDDEENYRPSRKAFLSQSDSQNSDESENCNDHTTNDSQKANLPSDDSNPPVKPKSGINQLEDDNEEGEENQFSIEKVLSTDSAQYAVYPPRGKKKESESSDSETTEQSEQENIENQENENQKQLSDTEEKEPEIEEQQEEAKLNEQQNQPESNEKQEEPELIEIQNQPEPNEKQEDLELIEHQEEHQKEDQEQELQKEQNLQISMPPLSVDQQQQQPLLYPQLNDIKDESELPVQQQPPILKFSSIDIQNIQYLDNFSFYPSPEQISTYYIPPPLLPISIHPPQYD